MEGTGKVCASESTIPGESLVTFQESKCSPRYTHALTHSLTHSLMHSLTHSLTLHHGQDPFAPGVRIDVLGAWVDHDDTTVTVRVESSDKKVLHQ